LVTSDGTTIDPSDVLAESRQVFVAFLDCLAKTNTSTSARSRVAVGVDLSPYFFGAPESGHALRRLGEIAAGPLSLTIRYATPEPELLPADDRVASPVLLGQHVAIDPGRDPDVAGLGDAGRGSLERAIHAAADLHAAKHGWLERIASRREGPFAMLQGVYGRSRWLDLNALSYGVDLAPSVGTDGELAREVVDTCARWRETLGLNVVPYGLGGAEAVPLGENEEALERIRRLADRYQPYPTPRPARFRLDDGANAEDVGALIRDAFLTTGCRSLTLV